MLPGTVRRLQADVVPHMGWNTVDVPAGSTPARRARGPALLLRPLVRRARAGPEVLTTTAVHGEPFAAAVERGPLSATQFHPEKSGDAGAALLDNWVRTL